MHSRAKLASDLRSLGVAAGDVVMVHASVRSVGEVIGGPDMIHLAIKDALTREGTLLMYAGCPRHYDEVGRNMLTPAEEAQILESLPSFDPHTARADRSNGTLVEFFRTYPGAKVNAHVARFAAWGARSGALFARQPWDYAYGAGSALEQLHRLDGKILLLGCDHDTVTFLHYVEHVLEIRDKRVVHYKVPVEENGARTWKDVHEFDTSARGVHPNWTERMFAQIVDSHLLASRNAGGPVGDAWCYLVNARALADFASAVMRRVAADARAADELHELPPRGAGAPSTPGCQV